MVSLREKIYKNGGALRREPWRGSTFNQAYSVYVVYSEEESAIRYPGVVKRSHRISPFPFNMNSKSSFPLCIRYYVLLG